MLELKRPFELPNFRDLAASTALVPSLSLTLMMHRRFSEDSESGSQPQSQQQPPADPKSELKTVESLPC